MSSSAQRVRRALLELGLEDWIPLPEAVTSPEVTDASVGYEAWETVRDALAFLLGTGQVRLYLGPWDGATRPVPAIEALRMVQEPRWYRYRLDEPHEERLYFVNVANDRSSPQK